ncbi:hypothetical protein DPMN_167985 [Dreissena polymorpha]|uniref:Uncharacterized protein n=1 Tax=Dreissena polymorpha TaxID=45954 RepID=A0A9D4F5K5_DREPO|nr:hypothetical protein DPMN_167985 [Dreissena polymorpha]
MSNDTDSFVLLFHFTPYFQTLGMKEIWQQYGSGEKRRMLPLYRAISRLGTPLANTMVKAHILTGDECMSKVRTKHAAVTSDPVQLLMNFGETYTLSKQDEALAEKYLVRVWAGARSTTTAETFETSPTRLENYTSASPGLDCLPPTSSVIKGHIRRGAFLIHRACTLLINIDGPETRLAPVIHGGWEEHLGMLLSTKCLNPLPWSLLILCKCTGKCDTRRCPCHAAGVLCITFCHSKVDNSPCGNLT